MTLRRRLLPEPGTRVTPDVSLAIVNIVLLLILFFLATGALINTPDQGVDIAETLDLKVDQLPPPLLTVREDRSLALDGLPIERGNLAEALTDETVLHVLIDRQAPALDLLELLAEPGLDALEIRLVTLHKQEGP